MTVTANTTRNDYTAGANQVDYEYTFQIHQASDVDVYLNGVKQTLNTHYTIDDIGNATGGTVTFTLVDENNASTPPPENAIINIVMAMDLDRDTNYQPSGAFLAADVNNDFDRLWHSTNQQQTAINRSLRLQDTDVTTSSMELPLKDARKGKLLAFNASTGDPEATSNNQSNWDAAYNDKINSAAFSGSTLTLTQQDGGTVTASHTPYLPLTGGTLTGNLNIGNNRLDVGQLNIRGVTGDHSVIEETGNGNLTLLAQDLHLDSSVTQVNGNLTFQNNRKIIIGNNNDLEIYSDGNTALIKETGGGNLSILGTDLFLANTAGTKNYLLAQDGLGVTTYYNGNPRLATTNAGITVTGTLTATGYNDSNWNTAYNNHITGVNYTSGNNTLTLTQQDGDTLTTTINAGGSSQWTTSGSDIYYSSGKVGIGNGNPASQLDIKGTGGDTSGFAIRSTNEIVKGYFGSDSADADFLLTYVGSNSAELKLKHNGNVTLCEAAGKVGINNSDPQESLHTAGNIRLGDTTPAELYTNSNELRLGVDKNNDNDTSKITFYANNAQKAQINKDGKFSLGTTRTDSLFCIGSNTDSVSGTMNIQHQTNAGHKIVAKDTDSSTAFSASVIDMDVSGDQAITGSQVYHRGLNIDIDSTATGGTTTNEHRLYGIDTNVTATGDSDLIYGINATGVTQSSGAGDDNQNTQVQGANFVGSNQSSGDAIVPNTYGAKFVSFNRSTSSDTGIRNNFGSVSESILHADGTKKAQYRGAYNKVEMRETTNACNVASVYGTYSGIFNNQTSNVTLDGNQFLYYGSYHNTEGKVTADSEVPYGVYIASDVDNYFAGNVGIGNNDPQQKLDVAGQINADDAVHIQGTGYARLEVGGGTGAYIDLKTPDSDDYDLRMMHDSAGSKFISPNADVKFDVGGQLRTIIKAGGNVGIGTDNPTSTLQVAGTSPQVSITNSQNKFLSFDVGLSADTDTQFITVDQADALAFGEKLEADDAVIENEWMRIDASGNLLVGTTDTNPLDNNAGTTADNGIVLGGGKIKAATNASIVLDVNRTGTVGEIARFRHNGTTLLNIEKDGNNNTVIHETGSGNFLLKGAAVGITDTNDHVHLLASGDSVSLYYNNVSVLNTIDGGIDVLGKTQSDTFQADGGGSASAPVFTKEADTNTGMYFPAADTIAFSEGGTERMRINSSGNVLIGTTSGGSFGAKFRVNGRMETSSGIYAISNGSEFQNGGSSGVATIKTRSNTSYSTSAQKQISFLNLSGTEFGSIAIVGAATVYNTSSDERLKENIQDANDAGSKIDAIQIRQFDWISEYGGAHQDYGVIAQELLPVAPEAVSEGYTEDDMMSVDYSKLVPTLIKEIQSLRTRVAQLENN